ncbi:MAG: hypothetical protein IJS09_04060 [Treponema sp.]|nr:hypothetical protein [Treponema sp.]
MAVSKKQLRYEHYILKGKLRHNGYERWRYSFVGVNKITGEERSFFIELYLVNPAVSPKNPVLAQTSKLSLSNSDLQYTMAGTESARNASQERAVQPSYVLVKAGMFGYEGKQFNRFMPSAQLQWNKSESEFRIEECSFGDEHLAGFVRVTERELRESPELLCNTGAIDWNLHYEKHISSAPLYSKKNDFWIANGAKTVFAGVVHVDGVEYTVVPRKSSGYIDRLWGAGLPSPAFHISSSNLISIISGKPLVKSCFAINGEYDGALKLFVCHEGEVLQIKDRLFDKLTEVHDCFEMPVDADGEKLHWTVSVHRKRLVIDVDIFCKTEEMFVRDYEAPEGQRKLLKVLGGGTGFGEIRIYKKIKKNLELLEHAHVADALCEYGTIDQVGK